MPRLPIIGSFDGFLRRQPKSTKRRRDRLENLTAHGFRILLEVEYGGYYKYESEEEDEYGHKVINGVYILKSYLPKRPPKYLAVSFERSPSG